jgi:hypothetical protein
VYKVADAELGTQHPTWRVPRVSSSSLRLTRCQSTKSKLITTSYFGLYQVSDVCLLINQALDTIDGHEFEQLNMH